MDHDLVVAQVNALGKEDEDNLAVIAVDNDALSYAATSSSDPWPFVVITAPVSSRLDSGEPNPYAYQVCNQVSSVPVRVLVFDLNQVSAVTVTAGATVEAGLTRSATMPQLWTGSFDPSGLPEGEATMTVNAYGSRPRTREIHFLVADTACPDPVDRDAGTLDADLEDASMADTGTEQDGAGPGADASGHQDGASQSDAEVIAGTGADSGCGCRAGDRAGSVPSGLFFLFAGLWLLLGRSRRRR